MVLHYFREPKSNIPRTIMSGFSAEEFLSRCTKNFVGNPSVLTFRKFMVAKILLINSGRQYQFFWSKKFCLNLPENSIGEPFCGSLISGIDKR